MNFKKQIKTTQTFRQISLTVILALISMLFLAATSLSQTPPMAIHGQVYINGLQAGPNLNVSARIGGTIVSSVLTNETGYYSRIQVPVDKYFGQTVDLYVGEIYANSTLVDTTPVKRIDLNVPPPMVKVVAPTTTSPIYARTPTTIYVSYNYTKSDPENATIKVHNATHTIGQATNSTPITPGTNLNRNDPVTITAAADGKYNVTVTIYNVAGGSVTDSQKDAVIVDNTPPVVSITHPAPGQYMDAVQTIWINGTFTEKNINLTQPPVINHTGFILAEWTWNSTTYEGTFAFSNITALADGTYHIMVNITDLAGKTGSVTVYFTLDTTPPTISNPYQEPPGQIVEPGITVYVDFGAYITIRVNVTDTTSPIESVKLWYNTTTLPWTSIEMNRTTGNEYVATIPSSQYEVCTIIRYYVDAVDYAGNVAKTPTTEMYFQSHIIPEFSPVTHLLVIALSTIMITIAKKRKRVAT